MWYVFELEELVGRERSDRDMTDNPEHFDLAPTDHTLITASYAFTGDQLNLSCPK